MLFNVAQALQNTCAYASNFFDRTFMLYPGRTIIYAMHV